MDQPNPNFAGDYDTLLELVKSRASVRKLKPDPIPDEHVTQILEVGRWAMSGANGQPWDFIVGLRRLRHSAIKTSEAGIRVPTSRALPAQVRTSRSLPRNRAMATPAALV